MICTCCSEGPNTTSTTIGAPPALPFPRQDLLEYLSQLLGVSDTSVVSFVDDLCRFQRGEFVLPLQTESPEPNANPPKPTIERDYSGKDRSRAKEKTAPRQKQPSMSKLPAKQQSTTTAARSGKPTPTSMAQRQEPTTVAAATTTNPAAAHKPTAEKAVPRALKEKPQSRLRELPKKGKAAADCGCFGTLHEALTNCLYCGRVACREEGYTFCPCCGYQLSPVQPPDDGNAYVTRLDCIRNCRLLRTSFSHPSLLSLLSLPALSS